MKALLITIAVLFLAGLASLYGGYNWVQTHLNAPLHINETTRYTVRQGAHIGSVARDLEAAGIVPYAPFLYKIATRLMKRSSAIKAGEYDLSPNLTPLSALALFTRGSNVQYFVTFSEGLTSYEIVEILRARDDLSGEISAIPPEGSLLPETYSYQKGEARSAILARMSKALTRVLDAAWEARANGLPLKSREEALILASIIEKETGEADERSRVSGVFINRLRKGMKLQTDPTVIYALTQGRPQKGGKGPIGRRLLRKDLKINSPYNTYKYVGLPPAPIANAGAASIKAALSPEAHDYIYFVADGSGGHAFAKTLAEHNRNVAAWRKVR